MACDDRRNEVTDFVRDYGVDSRVEILVKAASVLVVRDQLGALGWGNLHLSPLDVGIVIEVWERPASQTAPFVAFIHGHPSYLYLKPVQSGESTLEESASEVRLALSSPSNWVEYSLETYREIEISEGTSIEEVLRKALDIVVEKPRG